MSLINIQTRTFLPASFTVALEKQLKIVNKNYTSPMWGTRRFFEENNALNSSEKGLFISPEVEAFPFLALLQRDQDIILQLCCPNFRNPLDNKFKSYMIFHGSKWKHLHFAKQRLVLKSLATEMLAKHQCSAEKPYHQLFVSAGEITDRRFEKPLNVESVCVSLHSSLEWFNLEQTTYKVAEEKSIIKRRIEDNHIEKQHALMSRGRVTVDSLRTGAVSITAFGRSFDSFFTSRANPTTNVQKPFGRFPGKERTWQPRNRREGCRSGGGFPCPSREREKESFQEEKYVDNETLPLWEFGDTFEDDVSCSRGVRIRNSRSKGIDQKPVEVPEVKEEPVDGLEDFGFG